MNRLDWPTAHEHETATGSVQEDVAAPVRLDLELPETNRRLWSIVLAAGDGTRLRELTLDAAGRSLPKQYWAPNGGETMIQWALDRTARVVAPERTYVVVARQHRALWTETLAFHPDDRIVEQPSNRGTAAGILLPLLHVLSQEPDAIVFVTPSDHYVEDEATLARAVRRAVRSVEADPGSIVLLGIAPDAPETEYGWIVRGPNASGSGKSQVQDVAAFSEKPSPGLAQDLFARGALWNSFMFVGHGRALLQLFLDTQLELAQDLVFGLDPDPRNELLLTQVYETLPVRDFSRDVLQAAPERLRLLEVPSCGWTDLGTPARLAGWRQNRQVFERAPETTPNRPASNPGGNRSHGPRVADGFPGRIPMAEVV